MIIKSRLNSNSLDSNYSKLELMYLTIIFLAITQITRILIDYDYEIGFILFLLFLFPVVLHFKIEHKTTLAIGYLVFMVAKINYLLTVEPVNNPDSVAYIGYYGTFGYNYSVFFNSFINDISHNFIFANLFNTFGFLYITFFEIVGDTSPLAMNIYNTILTLLTVYMFYDLFKKHFPYKIRNLHIFSMLFLTLCLVSPQLIYWSSIVRKETTIMFFSVLSLWLLLNKRYFLLILVSAYAYTIRQYTFVPVILYFLLFKKMYKTVTIGTIFSLCVVFLKTGLTGVINSFYTLGISFFSPNPLRYENWQNLFFRTTESVWLLIGMFICLVIFVTHKKARGFFVLSFLCILSYTAVLELVNYDAAQHYDIAYGVGVAGDDLSRKKFFIIFFVYMMVAYASTIFLSRIKK